MVKVFRINKDSWKKELEDRGFKILCISYVGGEPVEIVVEPLKPSSLTLKKFAIRNLDFEELSEEHFLDTYRGKLVDKIKKEKNK